MTITTTLTAMSSHAAYLRLNLIGVEVSSCVTPTSPGGLRLAKKDNMREEVSEDLEARQGAFGEKRGMVVRVVRRLLGMVGSHEGVKTGKRDLEGI